VGATSPGRGIGGPPGAVSVQDAILGDWLVGRDAPRTHARPGINHVAACGNPGHPTKTARMDMQLCALPPLCGPLVGDEKDDRVANTLVRRAAGQLATLRP
jgi:hypothetical protein